MATFKAGDKFRYIHRHEGEDRHDSVRVPVGEVGTVVVSYFQTEYQAHGWIVRFDAYQSSFVGRGMDGTFFLESWQMAPLTDPGADAFLESIKRLAREPINVAPKQTVSQN